MLSQLYIRNYVLIDQLDVDFYKGMSAITGETGAGKSILFGALSLLKGKRADLNELKDQARKCVIEARIQVSKYKLREHFEKEDLDYQDEAIFRREVNPNGKSRAFINDTPVKLEQMQRLGELLFDIHSQHQSLDLNDANYRLQIVDEIAGLQPDLSDYQLIYKEYKGIAAELERIIEISRSSRQEEDYLQFQFEELQKLALEKGEEEELENEHSLLANGDQMMASINHFLALIDSDERSLLSDLKAADHSLVELSGFSESFKELRDRFFSAQIELADIFQEVDQFKDDFEFDAERLQFIDDRLSEIHRLKQKHGVPSGDDLIQLSAELESKLSEVGDYEERVNGLRSELELKRAELLNKAEQLSEARSATFDHLSETIISTLKKLGIPEANFQIQKENIEAGPKGIDKIEFLFSANRGKAPQSVRQVASGGELSRLMLAIKRELAGKKQMPALLFDEIGTGVSGEVADQLGRILREMSQNHQIIAITHLPQLAARGNHHYYVFKELEAGISKTSIKQLDENQRVEELAKMLSGEKVSEAAIDNARNLLAH
jgi:DNA repair protein RecN (Recombination protein N)